MRRFTDPVAALYIRSTAFTQAEGFSVPVKFLDGLQFSLNIQPFEIMPQAAPSPAPITIPEKLIEKLQRDFDLTPEQAAGIVGNRLQPVESSALASLKQEEEKI